MAYFFDSEENVRRLKETLKSWEGTPWRHRTAVKGLGADCIHFVLGVLGEMGILDLSRIPVPDYPPDWHLHNTREMLYEGLHRYLNVVDVPVSEVRNGDIILIHFGKAASHAAFYLDGFIYHCVRPGGVSKGSFNDRTWRKRMKIAVRLLS
ncbi:MAG: C40 family peptidase [Deltaproteobacteria bacterium]|nr:C40 family peptidase [Deltaproteobacteria bacterium]